MNKKDKTIVDETEDKTPENALNEDCDDTVSEALSESDSNGNPSYEELFDKHEELEKQLLRSNADLDNAIKRTLSEVEKAQKMLQKRTRKELN
jgi:molecular chaperone GrpE